MTGPSITARMRTAFGGSAAPFSFCGLSMKRSITASPAKSISVSISVVQAEPEQRSNSDARSC